MSIKTCSNGHTFEKTSSCPVCPKCSARKMAAKFGKEFPKIGAPAFRALDSKGINKLSQLSNYTETELLALHGFGPKALRILREALAETNQSFKSQ